MKTSRTIVILLMLMGVCLPLQAEEPTSSRPQKRPSTGWPMFIGDGDRTPPKLGTKLVDYLDAMQKVWTLDHHMGVGKGLYPGTLRKAREMGIEPFYGGTASPVVADGTVFSTYYKPNGKIPAVIEPWRTVSDPKSLLPKWFFSVGADDICMAVDAETGNIKWRSVEKDRGLNRLGHKRSHWCVSPAYADGHVFSMGSAGLLYAYDAKTGNKLWERPTSDALTQLKQEHLKSRKLCWSAQEGASLVVADDTVIVARRSMMGINTADGNVRWRIDETVQSRYATPSLWRHGGRDYLVAHTETGDLRLVDQKNGRVIWHVQGLGPELGTLTVTGDTVILNVGSKDGDAKYKYGIYGALRLSLEGAERLWTLPDTPRYQHWWKMDSGAFKTIAMQDGRAYMIIRRANKTEGPRTLLIVVDVTTGKILSEQDCSNAHSPYLMEDRLLVYHDRAHSDPVTASWWTTESKLRQLTGMTAFPHVTITAYEVPIQWPYVEGFLYCKALRGLVCYDLRDPASEAKARSLRLTIPAALTGRRSQMEVMLYERNDHLTHGGFYDADSLHAVDISEVKWNGRRLSGTMKIDVESNRRHEAYQVSAKLTGNGRLEGKITVGIDGFQEPIKLSGAVNAMEHQPNWMPECTHVLRLEEASLKADRSRQYLLLFVTVKSDRLVLVEGFAPRTTKAWPAVDPEKLKLEAGRLKGQVFVRYRPDPWSIPLTEKGTIAAAQYNLDCELAETGRIGSYKGIYGIDWSRTAGLKGRVESQ